MPDDRTDNKELIFEKFNRNRNIVPMLVKLFLFALTTSAKQTNHSRVFPTKPLANAMTSKSPVVAMITGNTEVKVRLGLWLVSVCV